MSENDPRPVCGIDGCTMRVRACNETRHMVARHPKAAETRYRARFEDYRRKRRRQRLGLGGRT